MSEFRHYIAFPIPEDLFNKMDAVINKVKSSENKKQHAAEMYEVISQLSDFGLDYYFIQSLKRAKTGPITLAAITTGVNTGKKTVLMIGKKILMGMNNDQLEEIANVMSEILMTK